MKSCTGLMRWGYAVWVENSIETHISSGEARGTELIEWWGDRFSSLMVSNDVIQSSWVEWMGEGHSTAQV